MGNSFTQFKEQGHFVPGGVDLYDQAYNLTALVPEVRAKGTLVIATEPGDNLLKVNRHIHRLLVYRQMLIPRHRLNSTKGDWKK